MAKKSISKVSRMRRPTIKPSGMDAPDMAASDMAAPAMPTPRPAMPAPRPAMGASMGAGMKNGGTASSRADGIAQRGKTKGTMIMCGGGMARGKK